MLSKILEQTLTFNCGKELLMFGHEYFHGERFFWCNQCQVAGIQEFKNGNLFIIMQALSMNKHDSKLMTTMKKNIIANLIRNPIVSIEFLKYLEIISTL